MTAHPTAPTTLDPLRPITMQDVRLAAGEGELTAKDVLAACNAELRRRVPASNAEVVRVAEPDLQHVRLPLLTMSEVQAFAERLADRDPNKMEFFGSRRWDAYRYVVPAVIAGLKLLKPDVPNDVQAVRKIMHAQQRALTPPDGGWGNMSYLKGSYDDTPSFQAALAAYRESQANG